MKNNKQFTCSQCNNSFSSKLVRLVDKQGNKTCRDCVINMLQIANQLSGEEVILRKRKKEGDNKIYTCVICKQEHQGKPIEIHVVNFIEQGINPRELVKVCPSCLEEKVIRADFYCPRTSNGRDSWDPNVPEFDCYCPINL